MTHMKNEMLGGHLSAILTIFIWGTTFVATKVLLRDFTPIEILFYRFTIGYAALWLVAPRLLRTRGRREELLFAGAGLCGVTLYFLLENIALTYSMVSNIGVILSISPFFTAIAAYFLLDGENPTPRFFIGFASAITGIALIAFNGNVVFETNPLGDVLALSAAVWALYSTLMRKISAFGYNNIQCTRRVFFYGLLFMLPVLAIFGFRVGFERFAQPQNLLNILFLGLGASALCFVTWNWSVKILGAVKTSAYIYAVPVINSVAAVIVLDERITSIAAFGTVLTLGGLVISQSGGRKKRAVPASGE